MIPHLFGRVMAAEILQDQRTRNRARPRQSKANSVPPMINPSNAEGRAKMSCWVCAHPHTSALQAKSFQAAKRVNGRLDARVFSIHCFAAHTSNGPINKARPRLHARERGSVPRADRIHRQYCFIAGMGVLATTVWMGRPAPPYSPFSFHARPCRGCNGVLSSRSPGK